MHLWVPPERRGTGLARALLMKMAEACREEGVFRLEVDDMTDRCREPHNLYVSVGFVYQADVGPEMSASTRRVLSQARGGYMR